MMLSILCKYYLRFGYVTSDIRPTSIFRVNRIIIKIITNGGVHSHQWNFLCDIGLVTANQLDALEIVLTIDVNAFESSIYSLFEWLDKTNKVLVLDHLGLVVTYMIPLLALLQNPNCRSQSRSKLDLIITGPQHFKIFQLV